MNENMPLRCEDKEGALDMGIGKAVLRFAAENHPYFYEPDARPLTPNLKITDETVFAREVALEINREREDGSTMLTDMLDEAVKRAVENGCEGVDHSA